MTVRIIAKEHGGEVERWQSPPVDRTSADAARGAPAGAAHLLTAKQLEALQQQVHDEAHARGLAQGIADGRAEAEARAAQLSALIERLAQPFEELDEAVERELVSLAAALAVQLVRRELTIDPSALAATAREALALLPSAARDVVVRVHADDARLIGQHLPAERAPAYRIEPDPSLARGDVVIEAESSRVDGRIDARIAALLAAAAERDGLPPPGTTAAEMPSPATPAVQTPPSATPAVQMTPPLTPAADMPAAGTLAPAAVEAGPSR